MHHTSLRRTILAMTGMAAAVASPTVWAHLTVDGAPHLHTADALSSFMTGAVHPLTGLDHLAAMISVGMWSALAQNESSSIKPAKLSIWAAPVAFALTLLVGALLGLAGMTLPGVEPMIAASLLVLGLLVATRAHLPMAGGAALVAAFALFHGMAHGQELSGHAWAALSGMVTSTAALHVVGVRLGIALRNRQQPYKQWLARAAGGAVALLGLGLLTPAMASVL